MRNPSPPAKKGFSLLEILIATLILGVVGYTIMQFTDLSSKHSKVQNVRLEANLELFRAYDHILKVGRLSGTAEGGCAKAAATTLECYIDYTVPRSGASSHVRFIQSGEKLQYQIQTGTVWNTEFEYTGITGFEICDDADMLASCSLTPARITTAHNQNSSGANRFFRFKLSSTALPAATPPLVQSLQGAFFVRNPAFANASYQWGLQ